MLIVFTIEFDDKDIGNWKQIIKLTWFFYDLFQELTTDQDHLKFNKSTFLLISFKVYFCIDCLFT